MAPACFRLTARDLVDAPIVPSLSSVLELVVTDVTPGAAPRAIYAGKARGLTGSGVDLGSFVAGESHRYRFDVTYPSGRPDAADDLLQGAGTTIAFVWDAVGADTSPAEGPTLPSSPSTTPVPVAVGPRGVQLAGPTRLRSAARVVAATVRCPAACRGTVTATIGIAGRAKSLRIKAVGFSLGRAGTRSIRVRMPAAARRAIKAAIRRHRAVAVVWTLKVAPKPVRRPAKQRR